MNVLISGASGLVGSALIPALVGRGDRVIRLVRHPVEQGAPEIEWHPGSRLDTEALEGFDAVIHLAGENIFGRWTAAKKKAIYDSRVGGAQTLSDAIAGCQRAPHTFLSASAIGYYGSRTDEPLDEDSCNGEDFLAKVARDWEGATAAASRAGTRARSIESRRSQPGHQRRVRHDARARAASSSNLSGPHLHSQSGVRQGDDGPDFVRQPASYSGKARGRGVQFPAPRTRSRPSRITRIKEPHAQPSDRSRCPASARRFFRRPPARQDQPQPLRRPEQTVRRRRWRHHHAEGDGLRLWQGI